MLVVSIVIMTFPFYTNYSQHSFNQSERKVDIANGVETPDKPFEANPEHQDDTAGEDGVWCETVFLEQQTNVISLSFHKM